jgi:membrane-associated protease RseP (regulator of RpoE activity)
MGEFGIRWLFGEIPDPWWWFVQITSPLVRDSEILATGLKFSLTLLAILGAHELCHYFASRRRGIRCSLPYFIPLPFLIGTLGAIIRVRSPFVHRRSLLEVGIAGPLASFVLSAAAVSYGFFAEARIEPPIVDRANEIMLINDSIITRLGIQWIVHPPTPNANLMLGQVFWAGWIGLFVTMLNILPLGQLDGGHVWYALSPRLHRRLQRPLIVAMILAGVVGLVMNAADMLIRYNYHSFRWLAPFADANPPVWPGWLFLSFMVLLFIRTEHPPLLDPSVPLGRWRTILAIIGILILILTFLPNPFSFLPALDIPPGGQLV